MSLLAQATRADDDLDRVESAGLGASQTCLARIRTGVVRAWRTGHRFSISNELLNHLAPVMSKTLAVANLMGRRRVILGTPKSLALDRFSEVTKLLKASGLDVDLSRAQKEYARVVYDSLRDLGSNADATTRSAISHLIAAKEPPGRAIKILNAVLDKAGLGDLGQSKLETLYRTQSQIAYQTGRWAKLHERWDDLWGFRYITMHDDRVRPEHQMLDGTTLPKDDPFWQVYWPPNGWNCRCQVVEIYKTPGVKFKKIRPAKPTPPPDEGFETKTLDALEFAMLSQWGAKSFLKLAYDPSEARDQKGKWTSNETKNIFTRVDEDPPYNQNQFVTQQERLQAAHITVPTKFVVAVQTHVRKPNDVGSAPNDDPVLVRVSSKKWYVYDGHNRIAKQIKSGAKKVTARWFDYNAVSGEIAPHRGSSLALDHNFDESKHPRGPKGTHEGGKFVSSHSELHYVKSLGSSTGAELHEDAHGNKYVVKKGKKPGQAENEYLANQLYRAMGIPVPESKLIDGKLVMKYVEGKALNELNPAERAAAEELLRKHFAADAVMANWDVIGLNHDNIVVDKKGIPWRVDNGGSLGLRAQGSPKGSLWNGQASELQTMRQQGTAGQVFGSLSNEQVKSQAQHVVNHLTDPGVLDKIKLSDADRTILTQRIESLKQFATVTPAISAPPTTDKLSAYKALHDQIKLPLQKKGLSTHQIESTALANSLKPSPYHVLVSKDWSPEHHNAIAEQFPGKTIKAIKLGPIIKKELGTNVTKVKAAKAQGNLASIFSVTQSEKDIALKMAKTAKEKASAEALNVVEAKPAVFLPSAGSPHWAERQKIENGDTLPKIIHTGTYKPWESPDKHLSENEVKAIASWKGGSQYSIRQAMWTGYTENPDHQQDIAVKKAHQFISACQKAPKYEGVLFRGVSHITPGTVFYDALKHPGNIVELQAHMGCSRNSKVSMGFANSTCLMRIATKSARSIEDVHGYHIERETILERGKKFRVVGVAQDVLKPDKGGKIALFVDLEEVDDSEKSTHHVALSRSLWEIPQRRWLAEQ